MKNYIEEFDKFIGECPPTADFLLDKVCSMCGQPFNKSKQVKELRNLFIEAIQSAKKEAVEECIKEIDTIRSSDGSDDYYTAISDVKDKLVEYLEAK